MQCPAFSVNPIDEMRLTFALAASARFKQEVNMRHFRYKVITGRLRIAETNLKYYFPTNKYLGIEDVTKAILPQTMHVFVVHVGAFLPTSFVPQP